MDPDLFQPRIEPKTFRLSHRATTLSKYRGPQWAITNQRLTRLTRNVATTFTDVT